MSLDLIMENCDILMLNLGIVELEFVCREMLIML